MSKLQMYKDWTY